MPVQTLAATNSDNQLTNIDMKIAAYIVYGVSQTLYKLFGVNTPARKAWLKQEAHKLQIALDRQHNIKKVVNERLNGVYTTKRALDIAEANGWF